MGGWRMGERTQREAGRYTIISDLVTCSRHDTQPCGDPECLTDHHTQSLLSSPIPLTQADSTPSYSLIHPQTPSHAPSHTHTHTDTHTHTHTHTSTEPTGAQTQETQGPRGSAHTPGTWSVWEQPRVPIGVSHWTFHTLGATGTLEAPWGQGRQWRGLRLTQLGPDQTSVKPVLCKICRYDQWTPP